MPFTKNHCYGKRFVAGKSPIPHKGDCICFRCKGIPWNKDKKWSKETLRKMSKSHYGNKAHLGKKLNENSKLKISNKIKKLWESEEYRGKVLQKRRGYKLTEEHKQKIREANIRLRRKPPTGKGKDSPSWRGGLTEINQLIRSSAEYAKWRQLCMERDKYSCLKCGTRNTYLEVDHIKPFSLYPNLRFETFNGRTLCKSCHKKFGWRGSHIKYLEGKGQNYI